MNQTIFRSLGMPIATAAACFLFAVGAASAEESIQTVEGDGYHYVGVALRGLIRVVCPEPFTSKKYSAEKEMEVTLEGKNAYIKFLPSEITRPDGEMSLSYSSMPRDLYLECGGRVFSLILLPKEEMQTTTVVLRVPLVDQEKARQFEKGNEYEETLERLIRAAYREEPPDGYQPVKVEEVAMRFEELDLLLTTQYKGAEFIVSVYLIKTNRAIEEISDALFVPYLKKPLAITIVKPRLSENESSRMIVVTRKE
ncbi:MAG: type-F conjugative transfer system secretin TraK (plasmid) [Candidatus Manganitrophus sp.]|nr:MAG: type-F conjugative transfer system secretin TraK [Candidatus Manganitrophus sp.]